MADYTPTGSGYTYYSPVAGGADSIENVHDIIDGIDANLLPKATRDAIVNGTFVAANATHATNADSATSATSATTAATATVANSTSGTLTIGSQTFNGSDDVTVSLDVSQIDGASRVYYGSETPANHDWTGVTLRNGDLYVRIY